MVARRAHLLEHASELSPSTANFRPFGNGHDRADHARDELGDDSGRKSYIIQGLGATISNESDSPVTCSLSISVL